MSLKDKVVVSVGIVYMIIFSLPFIFNFADIQNED